MGKVFADEVVISTGNLKWGESDTDVGRLNDLKIGRSVSKKPIKSDHDANPIGFITTETEMKMTAVLLKHTLENMALAMDVPTSCFSGSNILKIGDETRDPFKIKVVGMNPSGNARTFEAPKAMIVEGSETNYNPEDPSELPITIKLLKDDDLGYACKVTDA